MAFNMNLSLTGMSSVSIAVPDTGSYVVDGKLSLPTLSGGGAQSAVVVTISQNSSPVYTGTAGATGFKKELLCAAGDVIAVAFSSSLTTDQAPNAVRSVFGISSGV